MNTNSNDSGATTPDSGATTPDSGATTPDSGATTDSGAATPTSASPVSDDTPAVASPTPSISGSLEDPNIEAFKTGELPSTASPTADAAADAEVKFTVGGLLKGTVLVAVGTKVREALAKITEAVSVKTVTLRDLAGKPVSIDRLLTEALEVTSVAKAAGG